MIPVPPFSEVSNNYVGGSKSFKEKMPISTPLLARSRISTSTHIRKGEMLPVAQQVNFAVQLDVLLSEIIRITR